MEQFLQLRINVILGQIQFLVRLIFKSNSFIFLFKSKLAFSKSFNWNGGHIYPINNKTHYSPQSFKSNRVGGSATLTNYSGKIENKDGPSQNAIK